jgi:hypothetical protein
MPHHPKPFFRTGRGWYLQLGKEQMKLAGGPETPQTGAAAWERYHEIMSERRRNPPPPSVPAEGGISVAEVFDKFLDWTQKHRAPRTYDWYKDYIQDFLDTLKEPHRMPAAALRPFHVIEWADAHPGWSATGRRGAIVAIQRPFNWAEEMGYIPATPIKRIKKPAPKPPRVYVSPEQSTQAAAPFRCKLRLRFRR